MAGTRDALLIATSTYESPLLTQLRSPSADAEELAGVLGDPEIGWFSVNQLLDASAYQANQAIERFFRNRSPDDLLVLHLSCHGIKDDDGSLYFAATDTDVDLLGSTAIPASFLHRQLDRCRAKSIVILIDCCYSGAFLPGMKGAAAVDAEDQLAGHGRAVLTATSRTEYAWESTQLVELTPEPSLFTEAVVHGLRTGEADRDNDGRVAVDELYQHVYERLLRSGARQTPRLWADLEYRVYLANSTRQPEPLVTAPASTSADPVSVWPQRRARRGQDALIRMTFTLAELALGTVRTIKVATAEICGTCGGPGTSADSEVSRCRRCTGQGSLEGGEDCSDCDGFGTVITNPCSTCDGEGRVRVTRESTVRIPRGAYDGVRVSLAELGETGPGGGPAGDLYLEIGEEPDERFVRREDDLLYSLTIPAAVAESGGVVDVETLDGPKRMRVPPGTTSGRQLRLAGLGFPHLGTTNRGDLLVTITVDQPRRRGRR